MLCSTLQNDHHLLFCCSFAEVYIWWEIDIWARCLVYSFYSAAHHNSSLFLFCICCNTSSPRALTKQCGTCVPRGRSSFHCLCKFSPMPIWYLMSCSHFCIPFNLSWDIIGTYQLFFFSFFFLNVDCYMHHSLNHW